MPQTILRESGLHQYRQFAGQVLSASGALVVGGDGVNPGHPVTGAKVLSVPVTAIDVTTRMTASAIHALPTQLKPMTNRSKTRFDCEEWSLPQLRDPRRTLEGTSLFPTSPTASSSSMSCPLRTTWSTYPAGFRADEAIQPRSCAAD